MPESKPCSTTQDRTLRLYIPFTWASNEYADRPEGALLELTTPLARRICEVAELVRKADLDHAVFWASSATLEVRPECLADNTDADDGQSVTFAAKDAEAFDQLMQDTTLRMDCIGGECITVTASAWYLTCYDKRNAVDFESMTMPLPTLHLVRP